MLMRSVAILKSTDTSDHLFLLKVWNQRVHGTILWTWCLTFFIQRLQTFFLFLSRFFTFF